jgi:hypothetical protein
MNAITLLKNLIVVEPAMTKLETAENVLNELHRMKRMKGMPFLTIRRAIRIQEKVVKRLQ